MKDFNSTSEDVVNEHNLCDVNEIDDSETDEGIILYVMTLPETKKFGTGALSVEYGCSGRAMCETCCKQKNTHFLILILAYIGK